MKTFNYLFLSIALCLLFAVSGFAQQNATEKKAYQNIEVETFKVKDGVEFTSEQIENLMAGVVYALKNTKNFENVTLLSASQTAGTNPADATQNGTLKIVGEITKYDKGNRAARYFIGFGAGATKVNANVKFIDTNTGSVVLEKQVDGVVWIGFFGGDSSGAKSGLAKEIANLSKKNFGGKAKKK